MITSDSLASQRSIADLPTDARERQLVGWEFDIRLLQTISITGP